MLKDIVNTEEDEVLEDRESLSQEEQVSSSIQDAGPVEIRSPVLLQGSSVRDAPVQNSSDVIYRPLQCQLPGFATIDTLPPPVRIRGSRKDAVNGRIQD